MVVTARPARFDGQAAGTPESAWTAANLPDRAAALDLNGVRRLVVVSAHPDDETLGAAGLIACLNARDVPVEVVVASDGEASHPRSSTITASALGRRRRVEMTAAIEHLAPRATVQWLARPDGRLAEHETELAGSIARRLGADATGTLVVAPWRADGHPDHEAAARAAARAVDGSGAAVVEFPIWAWLWATPDDPRLRPEAVRVLRLGEREWQRKLRAIAEHRSQIGSLTEDPDDRPVLTPTFLDHFRRPFEVFLPVGGGVA